MWPDYSRNFIPHVYMRWSLYSECEKCESTSPYNAPTFWRSIVFLEGFQTSPAFPSGRATCLWILVCSVNGRILIGKSTQRKPCPSATFQTKIYGLAKDRTRASTFKVQRLTAWIMTQPLEHEVHLNNIQEACSYLCLHSRHKPVNAVQNNYRCFFFKNHAIHVNELCGQSADFLDSQVGGVCS